MSDFQIDNITRRRLLQLGGVSLLSAFMAACARATEVAPATVQPFGSSPASAAPTNAAPAPTQTLTGVNAGKGAAPITPSNSGQVMITPNADFYTVAYQTERPAVPSDWKLTVTGTVDTPLTLTLDDIKQFPATEVMRTFECISNPAGGTLISNANWKAMKLSDLLNRAGVKPTTTELVFEAFDGYHTSIPLTLALDDNSFLAYEMNGVPLPVEHGQPLRCMWPGRYGMKQPKWLTKITAITDHHTGYWEGQGWSNEALILPNSRIDVPAEGSTVATPTFDMQGIGFSGASGIAKIEVSTDNGTTWQESSLVRGPTPFVWTNWSWNGQAPPAGSVSLMARVTTNDGVTQEMGQVSLLGGTFPNGTSAIAPVVVNFKKA